MASLSSAEKAFAALILFIIVFFSLFRSTESPPLDFDEGWAIQVAANLSERGVDGLQFSPGTLEHVSVLTSIGYPLVYVQAFWFELFGAGVLEARVMMAVYMLGFAAVGFFLLGRLYGATVALSALAILAAFPPFYSFGKSVIGEVPLLFFLTLFLLCFNLATNDPPRKRLWFILTGVSAGLCVVTKTMALALAPVLLFAAFLALRRGVASWKDVGIVAISASIPFAVWLVVHFEPGDSFASVLNYYTNPSALADKTATFSLNLGKLFTNIGPLFMWGAMSVWVSGVIFRMKTRAKVPIEEWVALLFSIVLIFSLLFRYFDARYIFPVQALAILFFPYSLYSLLRALPVKIDVARITRIFLAGVALMSLLGLYQVSFRSHVADSYTSHFIGDMTAYFSSVPDSTSIFFYNAPQAVPLFHGRNYYQRFVIFESWILGSEFAPIVEDGLVDMLVLGPVSKEDKKVSLDEYEKVAQFNKISVYKRKTQ